MQRRSERAAAGSGVCLTPALGESGSETGAPD